MFHKEMKIYLWEVTWKKDRKFQHDVFRVLRYFGLKNPVYDTKALEADMKRRRRYRYEDDNVIINRIILGPIGPAGEKPNVPDYLFWEIDISNQDWNLGYHFTIERVLARGTEEHWQELIRFYGLDNVLNVFRNDSIGFWPRGMEDAAREYFGLKDEDLVVYYHRLSLSAYAPYL